MKLLPRPPRNLPAFGSDKAGTPDRTSPDDPNLSLVRWAERYLSERVAGVQSEHTLKAKRADLVAFVRHYSKANGHARAELWLPRDTESFLNTLEREGKASTSINRAFATLRHFARWVHEQPASPFVHGLPTRDIKERTTEEPTVKRLSERDLRALFKAADQLIAQGDASAGHKLARPRRNLAILALLFYAGLRVSELVALERRHLDGRALAKFKRKGKTITRKLHLHPEAYKALADYLELERPKDDPERTAPPLLLAAGTREPLTTRAIAKLLDHLAHIASAHRPAGEAIAVHPHALRHSIGFQVYAKFGPVEAQRFLGHASGKHLGWYCGKTDDERQRDVESLRIDG